MSQRKLIISFEDWKERNPDLHNWLDCPLCEGTGLIDDVVCHLCAGDGGIDHLGSFYLRDVERDLALMYRVYRFPYPPGLIQSFNFMVSLLANGE